MTTDPVVLPDNQRPRAPSAGASQSSTLDRELWVRRHDRRELELIASLPDDVRPLAPLVLALARLAAQRDAAVIAAHRSGVQA